jgi:tetrapyrrole methylase family protein/MazG family protein
MAELMKQNAYGTITLLGLGPGDLNMLTREAWDWLSTLDRLYVRTEQHPTVMGLPDRIKIESFDEIYEQHSRFEDVYEMIIETILKKATAGEDITYAVPGHPFVAEATCPEIYKRAEELGLSVNVIDGLSFLEPTFRALGIDPFPDLILADAVTLSLRQTPGFPPTSPALIAQIYSKAVAADVKLSLMAAYPDDHPVILVHAAGTDQEKIERIHLYEIDHSPYLGLLTSLFVPELSFYASFESFQEVIARLRAPDGCPWDREQTHESLRPFLVEEAYETLDALDREDMTDLQEELGDLLLQIVLHAQIASEEGDFNIHHVLNGINTKLIRRHPHVFSEVVVEGVSGVIKNWEAIKAEERRENEASIKKGVLDGVPKALPALLQAQEIIERVRRQDINPWNGKNRQKAIRQWIESYESADIDRKPVILGEIFLSLAALAHDENIDAESALRQSLNRFREHFSEVEDEVLKSEESLSDLSSERKQQLWQETHPRDKEDTPK